MKKYVKLYEEFIQDDGHPGFIQDEEAARKWILKYASPLQFDYIFRRIDGNLVCDCMGTVGFKGDFKYILVQFNNILAPFQGEYNEDVSGFSEDILDPEEAGTYEPRGDFFLENCWKLKSLKGCPVKVTDEFSIRNCPELRSLEGCPQNITTFGVTQCHGIINLIGAPDNIEGSVHIYDNRGLVSLDGCPSGNTLLYTSYNNDLLYTLKDALYRELQLLEMEDLCVLGELYFEASSIDAIDCPNLLNTTVKMKNGTVNISYNNTNTKLEDKLQKLQQSKLNANEKEGMRNVDKTEEFVEVASKMGIDIGLSDDVQNIAAAALKGNHKLK